MWLFSTFNEKDYSCQMPFGKDANMSAKFEEKHQLMLMTLPKRVT
jgi:hypothetical protein